MPKDETPKPSRKDKKIKKAAVKRSVRIERAKDRYNWGKGNN